ncbi:keratin-associated protein 13-1-like [Hyaena hyaena]|uniref:keratin-associated protein 13-1-like n=1 Tax=Hyaena hyaena TaxID=95912 RepID=UPI001924C663|nr:keratin-associated protein 13-1-like [Hyaena hyaena]
MSYSCCSGNFSSRSLGGYLRCPSSSYPSNLVYCTDLCSPSACQLGSSLYSGCQDTCCEPTSCRKSCVVSSPCHLSCYRPRTSTLCSPCWTAYPGCVGFGSRSCRSLGSGSRSCYSLGSGSKSCYSLGCGSQGFRSLGYRVCGFPYLSYGSSSCRPIYFPSRSFHSSCYWPLCRSGCY